MLLTAVDTKEQQAVWKAADSSSEIQATLPPHTPAVLILLRSLNRGSAKAIWKYYRVIVDS